MIKTAIGFGEFRNPQIATSSSAPLPVAPSWFEIHSLSPFVKKWSPENEKIRIASKNEQNEETAEQIQKWMLGKEVVLSHTSTIIGQHSRGIVEAVEYLKRRIEITVITDNDNEGMIWEDTDVWVLQGKTEGKEVCQENVKDRGDYHHEVLKSKEKHEEEVGEIEVNRNEFREDMITPPNPSEREILLPSIPPLMSLKIKEMNQTELFQSINGWKYLDGKFQRTRRKFAGVWKSVYQTELRMTPVEPDKKHLMEYVKDHVALRFSDDVDEPGDVFVEVSKKCTNQGDEPTITLGVTGFQRKDVDIVLSKSKTFYLNIDDGDEDDVASLSSEEGVLPGYSLEQNVDELCEKLGELSVVDVCIKTWFATPFNIPFIRLLLTCSDNRTMTYSKKLQGCHVLLSTSRETESVLAVVSKVMKDEMVLTLLGTSRKQKDMLISKQDRYTIRIEHDFEQRLRSRRRYVDGNLEMLRRRLIFDGDIKFMKSWTKQPDATKPIKKFATFTSKNPAFRQIPVGTKVLLSKCWEISSKLERKADFVFAVRVEQNHRQDPNLVMFEIKFSKPIIANSPDFKLTQAFYYVDFDFSHTFMDDPHYRLYDARGHGAGVRETARNSFGIDESMRFYIIENRTPHSQNNHNTNANKNRRSHSENGRVAIPEPPKITLAPTIPSRMIHRKHKIIGIAYIDARLQQVGDHLMTRLRIGTDWNTIKRQLELWCKGIRLALTDYTFDGVIRMTGEVKQIEDDFVLFEFDGKTLDTGYFQTFDRNFPLLSYKEL